MRRTDRLFDIIGILRDGKLHKAQDIADRLEVSVRTIYRDMDTLMASGVPIEGERGVGYMAREVITLPPLTLTPTELEALNLGMAIVAEAADDTLRNAAQTLTDKIDAVLPQQVISEADSWKFAVYPFASAARGASHMSLLRAAIKSRQKLRIAYFSKAGDQTTRCIRPLHMEYWGRVWTLTAWCELRNDFRTFRLDLIDTADALPELFTDEPGKTFADYEARL